MGLIRWAKAKALAIVIKTAWRRLPPENRKELVSKMSGWKTYLVAAAAIVAAWAGFFNDALTLTQAIEATFGAIMAATVRHGVTTEAKKALAEK